ncbi:MAG: gamma-glutamyl-phosphate reductase, partial [Holosporales bacterium]
MVTLSEQSDFTAIVTAQARAAKDAARLLYTTTHAQRNAALAALKTQLLNHAPAILNANKADMERGAAKGLSAALLDRLLLDEKRLTALA